MNIFELYHEYQKSKGKVNLTLSLVKDLAEIVYGDDNINEKEFRTLYAKADEILECDEFNRLKSTYLSEIQFDALIKNDEDEIEKFANDLNKWDFKWDFLMYIGDDEVLNIYEEFCIDNKYSNQILYPIHSLEDHFGPDVQKFIENNTKIPETHSYYTMGRDGNIQHWWDTDSAIMEARTNLGRNFDYVIEFYKKDGCYL